MAKKPAIQPYRFATDHELGAWGEDNDIRIVARIHPSRGEARALNDLFDRWMRTLTPDLDSDLPIERIGRYKGCTLTRTTDAGGGIDVDIRSHGADGIDLAGSRYVEICEIVEANDPDARVSYQELWRTPDTVEAFRRTRQSETETATPEWVEVSAED